MNPKEEGDYRGCGFVEEGGEEGADGRMGAYILILPTFATQQHDVDHLRAVLLVLRG